MGTPDFAVGTLQNILENGYEVVGLITAPDRPAGRGRKVQQSAVKQFALERNLPVLQPTNLKDENFLNQLKELNANLQVVVAFRMLPEVVWKMPSLGTFNLHASLLPDYRGAAPINWAIINGETKTGVTTFFIDEKIDTGAIIEQKEVSIEEHEDAGSLHDKLKATGANLVVDTLEKIEKGKVEPQVQPKEEGLKTAYKLNKENTKINWNQSTQEIYNLIRGLSPYPTAWSYLKNGEAEPVNVKFYEVEKEIGTPNSDVGSILIENNTVRVSTLDGFIILKTIQLPGKRKMSIKDVLNGYKFEENSKML